VGKLTKRVLAFSILVAFVSCGAWAAGYRTSVGVEPDAIPLVVVTGTPYEMGLALGTLMKKEVNELLGTFLGGAQLLGGKRYDTETLDAAWNAVSPYIHKRFVEELEGLADGAGLPFEQVRRAHMIPVVSDYACSGVAVWGQATNDGHLYQIRNLDYTMLGRLQDYPLVVLYVPEEGIAHVNVTFAGVIGVNTGMNAEGIALTEIGDTPGRDYPFDLDGAHFMTLFRDILYDAHDLDEAVKMITEAKRIKKYHYVVGDGKNNKAVKMKAHAPGLDIWSDNDPDDELAPRILEDIVYHAEGRDPIAFAHLSRYRGRYMADGMIQLSKSIGSIGGNLMNVVYDATALELWVAYADKLECAYLRPYVHIKLEDYLEASGPPEGAVTFKQP